MVNQSKFSEPDIIEVDSSYEDGDLTPREIILKHIDRISKYIFKGEEQPTVKQGSKGLVKTADRRQVIIQAMDFLTAILQPYYDEAMRKEQKGYDEAIEKLEKHLVTEAINVKAQQKAVLTQNVGKNFVIWKTWLNKNGIVSVDKEEGYYEYYINSKYCLCLKLFQHQNHLLFRQNYLAVGDYEE